jgi:K+-sensing histidine kinase KdpD
MVRADSYSLEDVVSHLLRNAQRHRTAGSTIRIAAARETGQAVVTVHNAGAAIADSLLERIFEYGVSGEEGAAAGGQRGQGLFVVRTYLAKMGGTVRALNVDGGVSLEWRLPLAG